jgi:hypothetical protein
VMRGRKDSRGGDESGPPYVYVGLPARQAAPRPRAGSEVRLCIPIPKRTSTQSSCPPEASPFCPLRPESLAATLAAKGTGGAGARYSTPQQSKASRLCPQNSPNEQTQAPEQSDEEEDERAKGEGLARMGASLPPLRSFPAAECWVLCCAPSARCAAQSPRGTSQHSGLLCSLTRSNSSHFCLCLCLCSQRRKPSSEPALPLACRTDSASGEFSGQAAGRNCFLLLHLLWHRAATVR